MPVIRSNDISPEVQQAKMRFGIIGTNPALLEAVKRAIKVAPIDLSVLITGESGAGKEFFPQIIHAFSARKHAKYIAVNCGAIPEGTLDSELFGHEKGSFTGAVASRKGYFEEANGGTIFLDEVAELPMTTQARLLRVLETGEYIKVGSSQVQKTNIRVVAATNVDMIKAVAEGRFREDLFYRLSTIQISVPPLRERGHDITLLARKFAADFAEKYRTPSISFSEGATRMLQSYAWPGNVRQLKNVVEQMALFEAGGEISGEVAQSYLPRIMESYDAGASTSPAVRSHTYEQEREMLFNLIFSLRSEIDTLKSQIERQPAALDRRISAGVLAPERHAPAQPDVIDIRPEEVTAADTAPAAARPVESLELREREAIRESLIRNQGKRKAVAAELKISERTLYRKIKEYGLEYIH